ncbi:two pore channel protein 2-like [Lineus longissimus]|uniref:two pore channel protein 2-like n=1 Tax=Lineus longissimus TaxID=88925 RepID=UPI00315D0349
MQTLDTESDPLLGESILGQASINSAGSSVAASSGPEVSYGNGSRKFYVCDPDDENVTFVTSVGGEYSTGSGEYKIIYDETTLLKATVFIEDAACYRSIHHKLDTLSLRLYRFYYSTLIQWFLYFIIFTIHMLAFFERPSSLTLSSDIRYGQTAPEPGCGVTEAVEMFCLLTLLGDVIIKCYLVGRKHLSISPWLIVYILVILVSMTDWCVTVALGCGEIVRIRRMLRPFFLLQNSSLMKKTVNCLRRTVPDILSVMMFLCLHLYVFTLCGMLLFPGSITKVPSNITNNSVVNLAQDQKIHDKTEGDMYFPNFQDALINLLVLLTTANNPDVMMPAYRTNRFYAIYFIVFLAIGMYCLMNMLTAVIYNQFRGYFLNSMQGSLFRRRLALRAAFEVLKKRKEGVNIQSSRVDITANGVPANILKTVVKQANIRTSTKRLIVEDLQNRMGCVLNAGQFHEALKYLDEVQKEKLEPDIMWVTNSCLQKIQFVISHRNFSRFGTLVALVNVICITAEVCTAYRDSFDADTSALGVINLCFILFYLIEQCFKLWANGWRRYIWHKSNLFDLVLTTLLVIVEVLYLAMYGIPYWGIDKPDGNVVKFYDLIRLLNILIIVRLLRVIPQIKMMSLVATTLADLVRNLRSFAGILVVIYYTFAILGMELFKNKITYHPGNKTIVPSYPCGSYQQLAYWANNFDDFASALMVLWDVMVQNNWFIFLQVYSEVLSKWSQLYFVAWWMLSVIISVNLFTALILENFIMRWDRSQQQSRREAAADRTSSFSDTMRPVTIHQMFRGMLQEPNESELLSELRCHEHLGLTEIS